MLYVFIATALVTIAPYLITFEKGQGIERGLFEYGIFALLLIYASLREFLGTRRQTTYIAVFYVLMVIVSWMDLQTILAVKKWSVGWFGIIPFAACALAMVLLKDVKGFSFRQVNIILFVSFFAHFGAMRFYSEQPLFQFSIPLYLAQKNQPIDCGDLSKEFRIRYGATDSVTITKYYVDPARSNVMVLVESWGIPMDSARFNEEQAVFNGLLTARGRKTYISALLTMPKPLTMWITKNYGKFLNRLEYQTTLLTFCEIYMQVRKQQLEPDMEKPRFQIGKRSRSRLYTVTLLI